MSRFEDKLNVMRRFAADLSTLSTCKRRKVGCVIVPRDFSSVLSIGINGVPAGLPNDRCRDTSGSCGCNHSEQNAIVKLGAVMDGRLLLTLSPCELCAGLIINSRKISMVLYEQAWRDMIGQDTLREAGVRCFAMSYCDLEHEWRL